MAVQIQMSPMEVHQSYEVIDLTGISEEGSIDSTSVDTDDSFIDDDLSSAPNGTNFQFIFVTGASSGSVSSNESDVDPVAEEGQYVRRLFTQEEIDQIMDDLETDTEGNYEDDDTVSTWMSSAIVSPTSVMDDLETPVTQVVPDRHRPTVGSLNRLRGTLFHLEHEIQLEFDTPLQGPVIMSKSIFDDFSTVSFLNLFGIPKSSV
jgi:hypothetical protein